MILVAINANWLEQRSIIAVVEPGGGTPSGGPVDPEIYPLDSGLFHRFGLKSHFFVWLATNS